MTFGELANIALLAGPAIGALFIASKDAAAGLINFATQATTAARGLAVVGGLALAAGGTLLAFKGTELDPKAKSVPVQQLISKSGLASISGQFFEAFA